MLSLYESEKLPSARGPSWKVTKPSPTSNCIICRDGWPRLVADDGSGAVHCLPEPGGSWSCDHHDGCSLPARVALEVGAAAVILGLAAAIAKGHLW